MDPEIKVIRELMASRPRATEISQMRSTPMPAAPNWRRRPTGRSRLRR